MSESALRSAEVAQDFREALQDMKTNNRHEITNLTVIAKENTEYAQAISRALEEHIRTTRPVWKLTGLYVLDSIVKNVGTPYTLYLSQNLYATFMGAYTLVDQQTRKSMEALLRTWMVPAADSLDARPVFPPEATRDLEAAMAKAQSITRQHQHQQQLQQSQARARQQMASPRPAFNAPPFQGVPYHNNPTPPPAFHAPSAHESLYRNMPTPPQAQPGHPANAAQQYQASIAHPLDAPFPLPQHATPQLPNVSSSDQAVDAEALLEEVKLLIVRVALESQKNPGKADITSLIKLLGDVRQLLEAGNLPHAALTQFAAQIASIRASYPSAPTSLAHRPESQPSRIVHSPAVFNSLPPQSGTPTLPPPPAPSAGPPPPAHLNPALSQLMKSLIVPSTTPPAPGQLQFAPPPPGGFLFTPPPPHTLPFAPSAPAQLPFAPPPPGQFPFHPPQPGQLPVAAPPATPMAAPDLMAALRTAGLLSSLPASATPAQQVKSPAMPLIPPTLLSAISAPPPMMETTSLKIKRPHLISKLYSEQPDQCRQCGRRFPNTPAGKKRKNAHMDQHFQTNTRVAESSQSAVNRSWYIDEGPWIAYRELGADGQSAAASSLNAGGGGGAAASGDGEANGSLGGAAGAKEPAEHIVPFPTDISEQSAHCSICQEKFDVLWHEVLQAPVWTNAIKVGARIYHKTCYDDLIKASRGGGTSTLPQESVLGKRKLR